MEGATSGAAFLTEGGSETSSPGTAMARGPTDAPVYVTK